MSARLDPADIEAIARRVAALLAEHPCRCGRRAETRPDGGDMVPQGTTAELLTANEVAERLGVTPEWVRDHADDLGVVRLGDGPRPRLRFAADRVAEAVAAGSHSRGSHPPPVPPDGAPQRRSRRRSRRATGATSAAGAPLLPIREETR